MLRRILPYIEPIFAPRRRTQIAGVRWGTQLFYPQFDVVRIDVDGVRSEAAAEDVDYYNVTQDTLIATLTTDADGILPGGAFLSSLYPVADGDIVELRHATDTGTCRFTLKLTAALAVLSVENHVSTLVLDDVFEAQEADTAVILVSDLSNPAIAAQVVGDATINSETALPFQAVDGAQLRVYAVKKHKDFEFHAASLELVSSLDLVGTSGGADTAPTFTSVVYDSPNSEADLVFFKNGTAVGDIKVEYKLTSASTWTLHGTDFVHGATSGSIAITEQPTPLTYDIRLYQEGVPGYSVTRQVTVDASEGGGTPPSGLTSDLTDNGDCTYDIFLSWTPGSGSDNYTVERRLSGGAWAVVDGAVVGTTYLDTVSGIELSSLTYKWRVKQNDITGYSNETTEFVQRCTL